MDRFASLRFDEALDDRHRAAVARAIASAGGNVMAWTYVAERSYVAFDAPPELQGSELAQALGATRFDDPALVVLAVRPTDRSQVAKISSALARQQAHVPACDAIASGDDLILEIEPRRGSVQRILTLVEEALAGHPGRRITPLLPLDDEVTASIAAARLREPDLDASRILDRYVDMLTAPGASS